ncbi:hypothetical protein QTP88_003311 [Uroleucon formosanum]
MDLTKRRADLKQVFRITKNETIKERPRNQKKNCWFSKETIDIIEQRRELKVKGLHCTPQYKQLSAQKRREIRRDKNQIITETCKRIEAFADKNYTRELFQKIKKLTGDFKLKRSAIKDAYGKEPGILSEEIEQAVSKLKNNKAPGSDEITAEMLKLSGDKGVKILWKLCNKVWTTGVWPEDWVESIFILLHKKGSTEDCSNYRTISLISRASKVLLNVIHARLRYYVDSQISPEQAGFVKGRGTREQILTIRQLIEKSREFDQPLVMCFIDYNKAFDCVQWRKLWIVMQKIGVPEHIIHLIKNLYTKSKAVIKAQNVVSDQFQPTKGVRQRCILSSILFNIYSEAVFRESLQEWDGGAVIGGRKINNLRFADDTTLCTKSELEMSQLIKHVEEASNKYGLTINKSKTKVMVIDRIGVLSHTNELNNYQKVNGFKYLGSIVQTDGRSSREIKRRVTLGREAVIRLTPIWKDNHISRYSKLRLLKALTFSAYRRMLRTSWMERRTNCSILAMLNIETRLAVVCKQRILRFFGHIIRRDESSLEKLVIEGKIEGKRSRGRTPMR